MNASDKEARYRQSQQDLSALLTGETDTIAIMSSIACVLKTNFPYYFWVGFYQMKQGALIVGPYQGSVGCLHIPLGKGVCGTAAAQQKTLIVADVHEFPGHIACDARSKSEIVVPVHNADGKLIAVLDVDSEEKNSFDTIDQKHLEALMDHHFCAVALD